MTPLDAECQAPPSSVARVIVRALRDGRPLSLVRLGRTATIALAGEGDLPPDLRRARDVLLTGRGAAALEQGRLAAAVRAADIVGCPEPPYDEYAVALRAALWLRELRLSRRIVSGSAINVQLYREGHLERILREEPLPHVLVVGEAAAAMAAALLTAGVRVTGAIAPAPDFAALDRDIEAMGRAAYDIALVSAGPAALPLCTEAAARNGGIHLDLGCVVDAVAAHGLRHGMDAS